MSKNPVDSALYHNTSLEVDVYFDELGIMKLGHIINTVKVEENPNLFSLQEITENMVKAYLKKGKNLLPFKEGHCTAIEKSIVYLLYNNRFAISCPMPQTITSYSRNFRCCQGPYIMYYSLYQLRHHPDTAFLRKCGILPK